MKKKLVLWGKNEQDEKLLVAASLNPDENTVDIWTFPGEMVTEEFVTKMMKEWRLDQEVAFPEENQKYTTELSLTKSFIPDHIKIDKEDIVNRANTEWQFIVLSKKMFANYMSEVEEFKEKISGLSDFNNEIWDDLKNFWNKVQKQVFDKNLFRDHANSLRDHTNELFAKMKTLRKSMDEEFKKKSKESVQLFGSMLDEVEEKIEKGLGLQPIFEHLKKMQRDFRTAKFTREDRRKIWDRLDKAFKRVKEKRFGGDRSDERSPLERLNRRYDGLLNAINKMEKSILRDEKELVYEDRKSQSPSGQLEEQLRHAKISMINGRIESKKAKLVEMNKTKVELESRIEKEKKLEQKKKEREEIELAKKAAQEKIASQIKEAAKARDENQPDLQKVAETLTDSQTEEKIKKEEDKKEEANQEAEGIAEDIKDVVGDAIDSVKGIASIIAENVADVIEEIKEEFSGEEE